LLIKTHYYIIAFAFFFFPLVYFIINNSNLALYSNFIITITSAVLFNFENLFEENIHQNNYHSYGNNKHPLLDFYNIPLANAQDEKIEKKDHDGINKKENIDDKYVVLIFDRGYKSTFTKAKPILDKYNFKVNLFIACDRSESSQGLNWDQVRQLQNEGHEIHSHGSDHAKLIDLATYEEMETIVREGKQCLQEKGFNPIAFQAPYNKGGDNPKIVDIISKYFDFAFTGHAHYMFLNCDGWENFGYGKDNYEGNTDCSPYSSDGTPKPTNRYAMKEWSHDRMHDKIYENKYESKNEDPHGKKVNDAVLENFIKILEDQTKFNKDGDINAIPIVSYHQISTGKDYDTSPELFEQEMKYLYENSYKVLTISKLGYDEDKERFYIKK